MESKPCDHHHHHHQKQLLIIWNALGSCFWQGSRRAGWSVFVHRSQWIITPRRAQRVRGAPLPEDLQQQLSLQEKLELVLEASPGHLSIQRKALGRKGACWWHTNQTGKGGCRHCYIHWKQLCHKLLWAELKPKRWKSPKPITIRPCWAASSDSSPPCSRSVKCGFTSSLGVILWQHSQLLQTCEGKCYLPQITFLEVIAQQSAWNHQTPRWAKAKAIDTGGWFWPTG